jgi:hypothetical protein
VRLERQWRQKGFNATRGARAHGSRTGADAHRHTILDAHQRVLKARPPCLSSDSDTHSQSRAAAPRTSLSTSTTSDARHEGLVACFPVASLAGRLVRAVRRAVLHVCRCPRERRCGGGDKEGGGGGKTNCTRVRKASLFSAPSSSHTQGPSILATSHAQRSARRAVHSIAARERVLYFCSSVERILVFAQCGAASAEETSQALRPAAPLPWQLYLQHVCVMFACLCDVCMLVCVCVCVMFACL